MNLQPNRTLWALTAGQRARYGAAIAALALGNLVLFGVPKIAQVTIDALRIDDPQGLEDRGEPGDVMRMLLGAAVGVVGLTALAGLLQYLRGRWAAQASEGIVRALRERLFGHLQRIDIRTAPVAKAETSPRLSAPVCS